MKILLLTSKSPWPPKDGGAAATSGMIDGLIECGAKMTVAYLNTSKHFTDPSCMTGKYRGKAEVIPVEVDTSIRLSRLFKNLFFSGQPYTLERFMSKQMQQVINELATGDFDIIQAEGAAMAGYDFSLRNKKRTKLVYRPHNIESDIWYQLAEHKPANLRNFYYRIIASRTESFEKGLLNSMDGIAAMSEDDLCWFREKGDTFQFISCPPCFSGLKPEYTEGSDATVFFIGALDWLPNIQGLDWFIRKVWPLIQSAMPSAEFHVAGRNPSASARRLVRGKNIYFHGEIGSSADFIREKQVMVVPLFSGSGVRMKIIESMSLGKSIVASPAAIRGMEFTNSVEGSVAEQPEEFAEAVIRLIKDGNLRKDMGLNGIRNVRKNNDIFVSAEKMMIFYSQLF